MYAPTAKPVSVAARLETCNLATATVATLAKPVIEASVSFRALEAARFLNFGVDSSIAGGRAANTALHSKDSPPALLASSLSPVVLRV